MADTDNVTIISQEELKLILQNLTVSDGEVGPYDTFDGLNILDLNELLGKISEEEGLNISFKLEGDDEGATFWVVQLNSQ